MLSLLLPALLVVHIYIIVPTPKVKASLCTVAKNAFMKILLLMKYDANMAIKIPVSAAKTINDFQI